MADKQRYFIKSNQPEGRWRAGIHVPMSGIELELDDETLKKIQADASLSIRPAALRAPDTTEQKPGELHTTEQTAAETQTRPAGATRSGTQRRE